MEYMTVLSYIFIALCGLVGGSFATATVWRLRARQIVEDQHDGEKVDAKELKRLKPLARVSLRTDHSRCLSCGHRLQWYDLIPLVSWLQLGGKCRYCREPIGRLEPLMEFGMMLFFVITLIAWYAAGNTSTSALIELVIWLVIGVGLGILAVYDSKWFLLPNRVVFPLIGLAAVSALIEIATSHTPLATALTIGESCLVLSGIYFLLYAFSNGRWIGFGDVKLGLVLGLSLSTWQQAFLCLFLANLIGCIVLLPQMIRGRVNRQSHVPFGPLLIAGWVIAGLFGNQIIAWYLHLVMPGI